MTNDDKDLKPMIEKTECQECKALVGMNEYHTFSHCLIAKAYPDCWRSIVKDLTIKTTPQQPSDPMKELDFKPNGYDMDGNPIQHSLSGGPQQPSENQTYIDHNTGETICASCGTHFPEKQPSEPLKELDLELQTARETVGYLKKKASEFKYSEKMSKIFEERSSAVQKLISIFEEE